MWVIIVRVLVTRRRDPSWLSGASVRSRKYTPLWLCGPERHEKVWTFKPMRNNNGLTEEMKEDAQIDDYLKLGSFSPARYFLCPSGKEQFNMEAKFFCRVDSHLTRSRTVGFRMIGYRLIFRTTWRRWQFAVTTLQRLSICSRLFVFYARRNRRRDVPWSNVHASKSQMRPPCKPPANHARR